MDTVMQKVRDLVNSIRRTEEYRHYKKLIAQIQEDSELTKRLEEFRRENYDLQVSGQNLFDAEDELRGRYSDLFSNPLAVDMIETENSVCRLIRSVYMEISRSVPVDPPK
ncbi:MAG: YlbF family regulator [Bilifractor sp.]